MATDYTILSASTQPSIFQAAQSGVTASQNAINNRLQQEALKSQTALSEEEVAQKQRSNQIGAARLLHSSAIQLRSLPIEQRKAVAEKIIPQLNAFGIDTSTINLDQHLDNDTLDSTISALAPITVDPNTRTASRSVTGPQILTNEGGKAYALNTVFDPATANISLVKTALGESGNLINRTGQTAEEAATSQIAVARQKADIDRAAKIATEQGLVPVVGEQEKSKKIAAGQSEIALDVIGTGEKVAPLIPQVERGIELLGKVETGGFDANIKAIADYTGADTADASELQSIFSAQLLSAMQSIKGLGAMSEGDRKVLESGVANWGRSTAGNKRILQNYLAVMKRQKQDAVQEIERQGRDKFRGEYERITATKEPAKTESPKVVNWSDYK